jgi:hypothetical protein
MAFSSHNLEAILLTGLLTPDGLNILQDYIDRTGDIQSITLALASIPPQYYKNDPRPTLWIET